MNRGRRRAMSERDQLNEFHNLVRSGDLTEGYGVSTVAIGCMHCSAWVLERHRRDGRRTTITDRIAAVAHVREVHGISAEVARNDLLERWERELKQFAPYRVIELVEHREGA